MLDKHGSRYSQSNENKKHRLIIQGMLYILIQNALEADETSSGSGDYRKTSKGKEIV
jgi:hypothetical protein